MAFTAADVLDGARDFHPSFDPKTQPDTVLLRAVERAARVLAARVAMIRPEAMTWTSTTTALPMADFSAGIAIPAHLLLPQVTALRVGGTSPQDDAPIPVVNTNQRARYGQPWPSAFVLSGRLYLAATAADWRPYASITARTLAIPSVSTAATTLPFENDALAVLQLKLAAFMATRRVGMSDAPPVGMWQAESNEAETVYLNTLSRQNAATDIVIQDAYGDRGGW